MKEQCQNSDGMNPKRERFCQEYMKDSNGTQAAIRAGYSPKTANEQAARLLTFASVQNRIAELRKQFESDNRLTVSDIRRRIENLADGAERDADKLKALDLLVKIEGMIVERSKVEHSGTGFILKVVSPEDAE